LTEISEKQGSSLLNNIFSTILNLASLQIRNSLALKQPNLRPFRSIRIVTEKILNSHSESCFPLFQRPLTETIDISLDLHGYFYYDENVDAQ
jgi:hypothetical protein